MLVVLIRFCLLMLTTQLVLTTSKDMWSDSNNLSKWYNSFDMCVVKNVSNDSVDSIMKHCESSVSIQLPPIRCRAGNTWPSKSGFCSATDIPFSERKNLVRSVNGFDDPAINPLQSFFRKLATQKGALLLIGDSVMQQFFSAVACELEREGVWKDPTKFTNTDEVHHVKFHDVQTSAQIKFLPIYHFVNGRFDRIANASMHHLKSGLESLVGKVNTLVVVLNMGLHYIDNPAPGFARVDYQSQMTMMLSYMHNFVIRHPSKDIRVFFRETTAQHFSTYNGYWPGVNYLGDMKLGCVPINDSSPKADWRNRDIENIILRNNFFNIQILRFYNITLPLWSEHPSGHMKDCTHFCWTPMLYQPLFHNLDQSLQWSV